MRRKEDLLQCTSRSKCRWVEEDEHPTKYFLNLKKKNYNKKTSTELHGEDGTTINQSGCEPLNLEKGCFGALEPAVPN